ncbi:hypothetical protein F0562_030823 [Nyssa sinensis]|uniref:Uncharacterized protein n=1 Tax=Nyssa sinensis TaxID=561372 RepID=A0A5J5B239_9ASTE|nr:hypothetical protein F0562_030823 [Nyssa sinensis]
MSDEEDRLSHVRIDDEKGDGSGEVQPSNIVVPDIIIDSNRLTTKGPTIDVQETSLYGVPIGIPTNQQDYSTGYNPNKRNLPPVPIQGRVYNVHVRETEVTMMVCPKDAPLSLIITIVECFSREAPLLVRVTRKHVSQSSDDPKGKKVLVKKAPQVVIPSQPFTGITIKDSQVVPYSSLAFGATFLFVHPSPTSDNPITTTATIATSTTAIVASTSALSFFGPQSLAPREFHSFLSD